MKSKTGYWPSANELKSNAYVDKAPLGVLSDYAQAVYDAYEHRIMGFITTAFREKNGERTDFTYCLYLAKVRNREKGAQIKLLEVAVQDDGWYHAEVSVLFPLRKEIGIASNEKQLDTLIQKAISTKEVKSILSQLLE